MRPHVRRCTASGSLLLVTVATAALLVGLLSAPASARPAPVDVSVGVATKEVRPYRDGHLDEALLRLRLDRPARVKLFVADASGRVVRKRYFGKRSARLHLLTWDARRAGGQPLPTGTYRIWFRAYKDGYSSVRSRTRSLEIQQQRLEERTTTLRVRGDSYDAAASSGLPAPRPDGSLHLGHGQDPTTDVAVWRTTLPARSTEVRARFQTANVAGDGPRPTYGYLLRSGAYSDDAFGASGFDGRWASTSTLSSSTRLTYRLVVRPFFNVDVTQVLVDVRHDVLVDD